MKNRMFLIAAIPILMLSLTCCTKKLDNPSSSTQTANNFEYKKISPQEAQKILTDDTLILDVRSQKEFEGGHVKNAVLLPYNKIKKQAKEVIHDNNQMVLVYCESGRRSAIASKELIKLGYINAIDIGGIRDFMGEIVGNPDFPSYYNYFGDELPKDIVTPIDFSVTKKINEQLQDFTFQITGNNVKKYGVSSDNTKYYIMLDENKIEGITIKDTNGNLMQELGGLVAETPSGEEEMYGFLFEDWNFDGYLDIGLWKFPGGSMRNNPYYYWLWDNSLNKFIENAELEEISDYATVQVNHDTKQIESYTRLGGNGSFMSNHIYENGKFLLAGSKSIEIVPSPDDKNKDVKHVVTKQLIDGELKVVDDHYEDIE